jgi:hypothetical protein
VPERGHQADFVHRFRSFDLSHPAMAIMTAGDKHNAEVRKTSRTTEETMHV